jgi:hypothetical protein
MLIVFTLDPILLSVLTDVFVAIAKCPVPGVYQAIVTNALPALATAITQSTKDETWIASSALDLVTSLMKGAPKGGLGDGFFALLGPALFQALLNSEDREVVQVRPHSTRVTSGADRWRQNGIECLTLVIRKGCDQLISFVSPTSGETGIQLLMRIVASLVVPTTTESEAGGLFVGDMLVHLLKNAGDSDQVRAILPELLSALITRMGTAKTATFTQVGSQPRYMPILLILLSQSLVIPFTYLIHTQRDAVLDLLEYIQVGGSSGLDVLLRTWCENAETFQGFWAPRMRYV